MAVRGWEHVVGPVVDLTIVALRSTLRGLWLGVVRCDSRLTLLRLGALDQLRVTIEDLNNVLSQTAHSALLEDQPEGTGDPARNGMHTMASGRKDILPPRTVRPFTVQVNRSSCMRVQVSFLEALDQVLECFLPGLGGPPGTHSLPGRELSTWCESYFWAMEYENGTVVKVS